MSISNAVLAHCLFRPVATVLGPGTVSALLGIAGAFAGLAITVIVSRSTWAIQESQALDVEMQALYARLRKSEGGPLDEAVVQQQGRLMYEVDMLSRREAVRARLWVGYTLLFAVATIVGVIVLAARDISLQPSALLWFILGGVASAFVSVVIYATSRWHEIGFNMSLPGFEELDEALVEPLLPAASLRGKVESSVANWLTSQGWMVRAPAFNQGFDLLAERDQESMLLEVKGNQVKSKDLAALVDATHRLADEAPERNVRSVIAVPESTIDAAVAAIQSSDADVTEIELFGIDPAGNAEPVRISPDEVAEA